MRFWVNTLKNPQLIFDVRVSDNVDAILAVIAQTFIDSCTVSEHKVGRVRAEPASRPAAARGLRRKGCWEEAMGARCRVLGGAEGWHITRFRRPAGGGPGGTVRVTGLELHCLLADTHRPRSRIPR